MRVLVHTKKNTRTYNSERFVPLHYFFYNESIEQQSETENIGEELDASTNTKRFAHIRGCKRVAGAVETKKKRTDYIYIFAVNNTQLSNSGKRCRAVD